MTDPATIRSLLGGDVDAPGVDALVDEAVSAELDGDFDALAADLGVDPAALAGAVRAVADYDERREELSSARDALRSPAMAEPSLDEVTRRRLVRTALDASHDDAAGPEAEVDRRPVLMRVGTAAVAAALLVVVAVGAVLLSQRSGDQTASDMPADGVAEESATADAGDAAGEIEDLGELDDLAAAVGERLSTTYDVSGDLPADLRSEQSAAEVPPDDDSAADPDPAAPPEGSTDQSDTAAAGAVPLAPEECAAEIEANSSALGTPILRVTGTLLDVPVVVVAYEESERLVVLVAPLTRCALPTAVSFAAAE